MLADADADAEAVTVYPDIIVHQRGEQINLLVIEAKRNNNGDAFDQVKLSEFMNDDDYRYRFGVVMNFVTKRRQYIEFMGYPARNWF